MKKIYMSLSFLLCISHSFSQNLVSNPDFEIYGNVPCGWTPTPADFAAAIDSWTSPTEATPDILSTLILSSCTNYQPHSTSIFCNGWQPPHSGNIFAGFYTYTYNYAYREYLQVPLSQPMDSGQQYIVSMYVCLADNSQYATNNMGVGFSATATNSLIDYELGYAPQINYTDVITDTSAWIYLADTIVATDEWQYLIIGNFYNNASTSIVSFNPGGFHDRSYYYVDDVSVEELIVVSSTSFNASDTAICEKFCTSFFDSSTNNPIAWQWEFPGGSPTSSADKNPTGICYATPGTYDVTLITTSANGTDTLTLPDYITVNPTPPFPAITQVGYVLTSSPASTYQWQLNAADIPGATSQSYTVLQSGTYTVIIGDSNGCVNSTSKDVLITGIDVLNGGAGITIYPNPSSGNFTIEFSGATVTGDASIEVRNAIGQSVFYSNYKISSANRNMDIDLELAQSGIYFITIKTENDFVKKKMVVIK
ncbi:MAG: T9SS type A sorting domain-containing protein [Chitinophagales bacterium]